MKINTISKATLGRLPEYLEYLKKSSSEYISSSKIAKDLFLGEVQVRKDLNKVCGAGRPRIGYLTLDLISSIENCLGKEVINHAIIIGAGKLGMALLNYQGFEEYGIKISAAFDKDESKINESINIYSLSKINEYCKNNIIQIGIIAVPTNSAQEVLDILIKNDIKAIWNFAPCKLKCPDNVIFIQENLALSLAHLNNQLNSKLRGKNEIR